MGVQRRMLAELRLLLFLTASALLFLLFSHLQIHLLISRCFSCCCRWLSPPQEGGHAVYFRRQQRRVNELRQEMSRLSAARLRLLLTFRDFDGNDFEALSRLDEDNDEEMQQRVDVDRLPSYTIDSSSGSGILGDNCSICLEPFERGNSNIVLPCMHHFHRDCIKTWLGSHIWCPVCKEAITS